LLHQGRIFPIVVVHGGTVGERGIELQLWRIRADGGNFSGARRRLIRAAIQAPSSRNASGANR
jgi:hypothetical protein